MKMCIISFFFILPGALFAFPSPPCPGGWPIEPNPEITLIGDSRAFLLGENDGNDATILRNPAVNGQNILNQSLSGVQNLGWVGASATDPVSPLSVLLSGYFFFTTDILFAANVEMPNGHTENWNRLWDGCPYLPTQKVVLNLGGNDILNFYNVMEAQERNYLFLSAISNPVQYLAGLTYGPAYQEHKKEFFWYWQFEVKSDSTIRGLKSLSQKILNRGSELIVVDVAPAFASTQGDFGDWKKMIRLFVYLSRLNVKT